MRPKRWLPVIGFISLVLTVPCNAGAQPAISSKTQRYVESPSQQWFALIDVWGVCSTSVYAVGGWNGRGQVFHFDGETWTEMVTPVTDVLRAVWGDSDDNVWAVGDHGVVLSFDGESWGEVATCSSIGSTDLYDVHGGGGKVYALGGGHLWQIAPAPCSHVREFYCGWRVSDPCTTVRALWVSPQGDYCVAGRQTWHIGWGEWHGVVIGLHGTSTNATGHRDVWGATEDDIYVLGEYGAETPVFHYDGTGWVEISPPVRLYRISGSSATEVFGLGGYGYALALYDGNAWTLTEPHGINGRLWGSSSNDIHIVWGSDIAHWNGVEYTYFMPKVPTLVRSFSCTPTESGIEVVWELSETGVGMKFFILRAVGDGGSFTEIQDPDIDGNGNSFRFVDSHCDPGVAYRYRVGVTDEDGSRVLFETDAIAMLRLLLSLDQNRPNPFNPSTTISFTLSTPSVARLSIYNAEGKLMTTLVDGTLDGGFKEVTWNGKDSRGNPVSSGVYFYRLTAGNQTLTKKMVLLK